MHTIELKDYNPNIVLLYFFSLSFLQKTSIEKSYKKNTV